MRQLLLLVVAVAPLSLGAGCGRTPIGGLSPGSHREAPDGGVGDRAAGDGGVPAGDGGEDRTPGPEAGGPDASPAPDGPLPAPRLLTPANGEATGSVWHGSNLRPAFRWAPVPGATHYDLEVDDSCQAGAVAGCGFPSPEANARGLTGDRFRVAAALPVATRPPVGRRYHWRVRACDDGGCSGWSMVRTLDVGRQVEDIDGDGFADLLVGAPYRADWTGDAYLYRGGPAMDARPARHLAGERTFTHFGWSVAATGDVNADGYGDFVIGAPGNATHADHAGAAYLYLGGPTLPVRPIVVLRGESAPGGFGESVAAAGDVNADGYADVLVGATWYAKAPAGRAYVFFGGAVVDDRPDVTMEGDAPLTSFGDSVAGGDLDGDGHADVVVGAPGHDGNGHDAGRVIVFRGGPAMDGVADVRFAGPTAGGAFGRSVAVAGDVNGDGFADLLVGAPADGAGRAYLFHGSPSPGGSPDLTFSGAAPADHPHFFGRSVAAAGDLDRDGHADLAVGAPGAIGGTVLAGSASVFLGGPFGDARPDATPSGEAAGDGFGDAVASAGDVDGDGHPELLVGAAQGGPGGRVYLVRGRPSIVATFDLAVESPQPDAWFGVSVR